MEPAVGIEPTTVGLQNQCSTTELCWLFLAEGEGFEPSEPLGFTSLAKKRFRPLSQPSKNGSQGWTRTNNNTVNSGGLYH